jgi:hypothetical protein
MVILTSVDSISKELEPVGPTISSFTQRSPGTHLAFSPRKTPLGNQIVSIPGWSAFELTTYAVTGPEWSPTRKTSDDVSGPWIMG